MTLVSASLPVLLSPRRPTRPGIRCGATCFSATSLPAPAASSLGAADPPKRRSIALRRRTVTRRLGARENARMYGSTRLAATDDRAGARVEEAIDAQADGPVDDDGMECVSVGMEAACVVSEDEGDVEGASDKRRPARGGDAADDDAATGFAAVLGGAALVSPFFLWGTSMVAMKEVLPATSPLFVATIRLVPAGLALIAWAASNGRPWPKGGMAWLTISLFAAVDGTAFQGCLSEGLQRTSAGLGSVIIDSQPLTVAVLASIIYGESLAPAGVAGLGLGVVGLLMLELPREALAQLVSGDAAGAIDAVTAGVDAGGGLWDSGEWWMLIAAQSMAVGTVMVRWVCKYADPVMATGWHMALGGVPLLAYSIATEPEVWNNLDQLGPVEIGGLAYTSLLGGGASVRAFFCFASAGRSPS